MKTRNDCEIACDCVKRANVVLHVGYVKKSSPGSTQLPTSQHLLSPSQPIIVTSVTYIHTSNNRLWSPLAYGLGGNNYIDFGWYTDAAHNSRPRVASVSNQSRYHMIERWIYLMNISAVMISFKRVVLSNVHLPSRRVSVPPASALRPVNDYPRPSKHNPLRHVQTSCLLSASCKLAISILFYLCVQSPAKTARPTLERHAHKYRYTPMLTTSYFCRTLEAFLVIFGCNFSILFWSIGVEKYEK